MSAEIVPFGKYKGQPVEIMAADTDYCEWLTAQPWFRQRYGNVYNTIINYGGEPTETPEHNEMQARFLDDEWCFRLADILKPTRKGDYGESSARKLLDADPMYETFRACIELEESPACTDGRKFEDQGWDVTYAIDPASIETHRVSLVPPLPACSCQCDHADCDDCSPCRSDPAPCPEGAGHRISSHWCRHRCCPQKRTIDGHDHCSAQCYWKKLPSDQRDWLKQLSHFFQPPYDGTIRVECKPDLGDDYPAVLRQVLRYPHDGWKDRRCVLVRRHAFEKVTWEQVEKIFKGSQIWLLHESDLTDGSTP